MTLTIYTAFARKHAEACKAASGFTRTAGYVYEHEPFMQPQRNFKDTGGTWISEGRGFPTGDETPRIPVERGGWILCLNMEYYGPEWHLVPKAMRALGVQYHKREEAAQWVLAEYLRKCVSAALDVSDVVGLYDFAPSPDNCDLRNSLLLDVTAYMPSLYLKHPQSPITLVSERSDMPDREMIPVISDQCVYPDLSGKPQTVPAERWRDILSACVAIGAKRAIYWRDCEAPESVAQVKAASDSMRAAARTESVGID